MSRFACFRRSRRVAITLLVLGMSSLSSGYAQGTKEDYARADSLRQRTRNKVLHARVEPHWFRDGDAFWYRNDLGHGAREFIRVDVDRRTRTPAFDHARLAEAMSRRAGKPVKATFLPFEQIELGSDGSLRFEWDGKPWKYTQEPEALEELEGDEGSEKDLASARDASRSGRARRSRTERGTHSPDDRWAIERDGFNLRIRDRKTDESFPLTEGGTEAEPYEPSGYWSPDSQKLVVLRRSKGTDRTVHLVESSPTDQLQPRLHSFSYRKPGDDLSIGQPHLFDVESRMEVSINQDLFSQPWSLSEFHWSSDSSRFLFLYNQRGHQVLRLISVDAGTGVARAIIDESSETFIDYSQKLFLRYLDATDEVLWASERDGWNHLYLVDSRTGELKHQVTKGDWLVRSVDRVDTEARQVWFQAGGIHPDQDPYHIHFARVGFDGEGLTVLTEGDGTHEVTYSPDSRFLVDTYSRVDSPPVTELRSAVDGSRLLELERADWSALLETGWRPPERFSAPGRDGKTPILGVIYRPSNFNPSGKYPVIEQIYAGPHGAFVPKAFAPFHRPQALAELGFVVVQVDGMGTNWRSRAFHDVCWKNLGDSGFPDRILWMQAAAEKDPALDLKRVGIHGGSAGGQSALGALLTHPEFYKVGVADCGCHDNRMDKIWWNEAWMGWPVGPHYAEQSNVTNAHKLQGKLLLMVGELDRNVDPASTMQVVNALIKARKDFDMVVFPGAGHGAGGSPYGERRQRDFFVRHLLHVEPPDRNQIETPDTPSRDASLERVVLETNPASSPPQPNPRPASQPGPRLDPAVEVRELIEQYAEDRASLLRSFPPATSPAQLERRKGLNGSWLRTLDAVEFDRLEQESRIDYLLLKTYLMNDSRKLDRENLQIKEIENLLPFAPIITQLEEARRRNQWGEPAEVAERLSQVVAQVKEATQAFEKASTRTNQTRNSAEEAKGLALRASGRTVQLVQTLRGWYAFHEGFHPEVTWWASEPYQSAEKALNEYATLLREKGAGIKAGAQEAIVGSPIGREALIGELRSAWISYSPEELIALAEKELAWCELEMKKAARDMGDGDDWKKSLERVKQHHVKPGEQPTLIRDLAEEAVRFLETHDQITIPAFAHETWRIEMMSPRQQLVTPFLTGGEVVRASYPSSEMTHEQKMMSMRGNNRHFTRATVHHEVIPGHHLQGYMAARHRPYRSLFRTPFLVEGWPLYWEMRLWDMSFARSPEDRVGMLFWRSHRCARIIFSLRFHLGTYSARECVDMLVNRLGHERNNATAEVHRSFSGQYEPLYQCAYMLGGLQLRALSEELVGSGKMTPRAFHDAVLKENAIPIELIRASLKREPLVRDQSTKWKFATPSQ